jgi:hypothetical protein
VEEADLLQDLKNVVLNLVVGLGATWLGIIGARLI